METRAVKSARSIWLMETEELNPRGISLSPILIALRDRYEFQVFPKTVEEANPYRQQGIVFAKGSFGQAGRNHLVSVTMYGDGFVAERRLSTDFSDAFLEDLLAFASGQFGLLYRPEMVQKRAYASQLLVRTSKELHKFFTSLSAVGEKLSSIVGQKYEPLWLSFGTDYKSSLRPGAFTFEREINKPFEQRRYYSAAPLQTKQHEGLLKQLEAAL